MTDLDPRCQQMITAGAEKFGAGEDAETVYTHVLWQTDELGILQGPGGLEQVQAVCLGISGLALWQLRTPYMEPLALLGRLSQTKANAMRLAQTGKDLASDTRFKDRGREVLRLSSQMLAAEATSWDEAIEPEVPSPERVAFLLEDYAQVADLQADAGDQKGVYITAWAMAYYLTQLSKDIDPVADPDTRAMLDTRLATTISHLGGLATEPARQLFWSIHDEQVKADTSRSLIEELSEGLFNVGQDDYACAVLLAKEGRIR